MSSIYFKTVQLIAFSQLRFKYPQTVSITQQKNIDSLGINICYNWEYACEEILADNYVSIFKCHDRGDKYISCFHT